MIPMKNASSAMNKAESPRKQTTRLSALAIGLRLITTSAPKTSITMAKSQNRKEGIKLSGLTEWRSNGVLGERKRACHFSDTPTLHYTSIWLLLLIPLQNDTVHYAADLEQLFLVVHHFRTSEPGNGIIFAQKDCLLGANFLTHPAENAANHVNIELTRILLDFAEAIFGRNLARLDFDGAGRANEFAELTGDATDAPRLVLHQCRRASIMFRQLRVPSLLRILHGYLGAAKEHVFEMPEGDRHPCRDRRQIQSLGPGKFGAWNGDSHINSCSCS